MKYGCGCRWVGRVRTSHRKQTTHVAKNKLEHLRLRRSAGVHPGMQPEVREVVPRPFVYGPGAEANGLEPDAKVREKTGASVPGRARQIHINVTIAGHGPGRQG